MDRVVFRSDPDAELRGNLEIGRELAKLRGSAPRFDAEEHKIHVAPFEDVNFEHRRTDLHGKIVFRHESDDSPMRQDMGDIASLVESPSRRAQQNDDESRPPETLLRLSSNPVNASERGALGQGSLDSIKRRAAN